MSPQVSVELRDVPARPKFRGRLSVERTAEIIELVQRRAVWVEPSVAVQACRDPADYIYLELALAVRADVIVSSDHDLLALHPWRGVHILRPSEYLSLPEPR